MSIPLVSKRVSFREEPFPDTRNPKPLFQTDLDQFSALLKRYTAAKEVKGEPKIKEIARKKLIEFVMQHQDYRDFIPKELNEHLKR